MKRGVNAGDSFYLECHHCKNTYDLVKAKRETGRKEPIRCPYCGHIVAK